MGIDLVAMCVNDLVVQGAEPLFFLDYFATGRLEPEVGAQIVEGIAAGCREAGAALIGGETAEMPGLYAGKDYDLAGFSPSARRNAAPCCRGADVGPGDLILGLALLGRPIPTGFSLVRQHRLRRRARLDRPGALRRRYRDLGDGASGADPHLREGSARTP